MPLDYEVEPASTPPRNAIGDPSAVVSLSSLTCTLCSSDSPSDAATALQQLFDDGYGVLTESTALAHATGHIWDTDIRPFLDRIRDPVVIVSPLPLETETPEERDVTNARLARLAGNKRLRARYADALADVWQEIATDWETQMVPRLRAAAQVWRSRLDGGEVLLDLFPAHHIVHREAQFAQMTQRSYADGTLLITPVAGRPHIIALPGVLSVSLQITDEEPVVARRRAADHVAAQIRPIADATRLTILAQLSDAPASVTELARALHIAQPTASVHLRQLREAGLVSMTKDGARSTYRAEPGALARLLADISHQLGAPLTADSR